MRSSGLHGKDGLTLRIQTQKEMRNGKMNERNAKTAEAAEERAGARSLVTVYPAAGASRSLRSLLRCASPRFAGDTPAAGANE